MDVFAQIEELRKEMELQRTHALETWESSNMKAAMLDKNGLIHENFGELEGILPEKIGHEKAEELLQEILKVYDLSNDVLASIEHTEITNQNVQLEIASPFMEATANSAHIILITFTKVIVGDGAITHEIRDAFENAFRIFFNALKTLLDNIEEKIILQSNI